MKIFGWKNSDFKGLKMPIFKPEFGAKIRRFFPKKNGNLGPERGENGDFGQIWGGERGNLGVKRGEMVKM